MGRQYGLTSEETTVELSIIIALRALSSGFLESRLDQVSDVVSDMAALT